VGIAPMFMSVGASFLPIKKPVGYQPAGFGVTNEYESESVNVRNGYAYLHGYPRQADSHKSTKEQSDVGFDVILVCDGCGNGAIPATGCGEGTADATENDRCDFHGVSP
jgi:hypothetical protein